MLPAWAALAVFAGLGLGLAFPFLALGFVPALRRRLPKPGPWMERFQRILSVPMFATALGLAWIGGVLFYPPYRLTGVVQGWLQTPHLVVEPRLLALALPHGQ